MENPTNQNQPETKLTVIILDYMKAARVVENVALVFSQSVNFDFKVIVIDNSSNESNANILRSGLKKFDNIEIIINPNNLGYVKAHNAVSNKIVGKYVLILNPDILLKQHDTLQKMVDYMDAHEDIGIIGPKQINDNGDIAMNVRAFPRFYIQVARRTFLRKLPILKKMVEYDEMQHLDYSKIQDVDWLQSSCILARKELWDAIGGFDEDYFLFMSDVQICIRAWEKNLRVVYYPETEVYADGKRVSAGGFMKFFQSWVLRQHVVDSLRYELKNFLKSNPRKKYYENNPN